MSTASKLFNIFFQLNLIAIAAFIIFRTVKHSGYKLYTLHPTLMAIGVSLRIQLCIIQENLILSQYLILVSHGILVMTEKNILTRKLNYKQRVMAHWVLQVFALILISMAYAAIHINKERRGKKHYQTTHSLFGLATYLLTLFVTFTGFFTKYCFRLRNIMRPTIITIIHRYVGVAAYILAMLTIFLEVKRKWLNTNNNNNLNLAVMSAFVSTIFYVVGKSFKLTTLRLIGVFRKSTL